jgi:ABC-type nitrate/sulfonate/bicarbonate transport system permease component
MTQAITERPRSRGARRSANAVSSLPPGMERRGKRSFSSRYQRPLLGTLGIVIVITAWQVCSSAGLVNELYASSPWQVLQAGWDYVRTQAFRDDLRASARDFTAGFTIGVLGGILGGLVIGWYRRVGYLFDYVVTFAYATPRVALVPLLIVWFGIGSHASIAMVILMTIFPVLVNTVSGISSVDHNLLEMARSMNVRGWRLFRTVLLPGSVPAIMSGVRLAVGTGLIGVIISEFQASTEGLGYMITNAGANFDTAQVFVGVVIVSLIGVILTQLARMVERRFDRWRPTRH